MLNKIIEKKAIIHENKNTNLTISAKLNKSHALICPKFLMKRDPNDKNHLKMKIFLKFEHSSPLISTKNEIKAIGYPTANHTLTISIKYVQIRSGTCP